MKPLKAELASVLLSFLLISPFVVKAQDTQPAPESRERPEIVVTYTRQELPKQDVAANVDVITREEIEKMPVTNAAEVLKYVPGVYVEFNGGLGSQATATIQGSDPWQVAVYQDGVPLNMLANPMTDLSYLPIGAIERIEVYKGAASSAWGSALGGVINIITREPDLGKPFSGEVSSSYGSFNTLREYANVNGGVGRLGYLFSYTHEQSDGFMPFTGYRQDAAYAKLNYYLGSSSRLSFVYNYDEGANEDPTPRYPDFWNDMYRRRQYQRLLYETSLTDSVGLIVEGWHQQFDGFIDQVFQDHKQNFFDYTEETGGLSTRLGYATSDRNRLNLGFDGQWGSYDFTRFASPSDHGNWAFYGNDTFSFDRFVLTGGLRYDNNIDFGSEVSPSAGAVYHVPVMDALVRAQVARGFSAPPGAWVNDPQFGNKDLEAETGVSYQVGGEIKPLEFLALEVSLFRADIDNLIVFNLETMRLENIAEATRQGVEGDIRLTFDCGLALFFGASFIDVRDDATGEVIEDVPRVIYDASASYTYKWMIQSIAGRYVDNNPSDPTIPELDPHTRDKIFVFDYLFKAKLPSPARMARIGALSLFLTVHNITDADYQLSISFPQPGRWAEGGVEFAF